MNVVTDFRLRQWLLSSFGWVLKVRRQIQPQTDARHDTHFPNRFIETQHRYESPALFLTSTIPFLATTIHDQKIHHHVSPEHGPAQRFHPGISVGNLAFPLGIRGSIVNRKVVCLARYSSCQFQLTMKSYLFYYGVSKVPLRTMYKIHHLM